MKNKVVLITGGTRGLGLGIAKAFSTLQTQIILNYRADKIQANNALEEVKLLAPNSIAVQADINLASQREKLVAECLSKFGHIDILINNAGVLGRNKFLEMSESDYDHVLNCNLKSTIFLSQSVAKTMIQNNTGNIINIASIAGHRAISYMHYSISKAGLLLATKQMAKELAPYRIRVNSISPGTVITDINRDYYENDKEALERYKSLAPLNRVGLADEIASAAIYLSSNEASYTTGTDIVIDGGFLC